ncbi:hypothetical protein DL93DRAFT_2091451 [Clavulina sp. PMI_390]|nr:hypothetical protein DL93DRAFT_2091451 [Clavulina sp. PMI_390]
MTIQVIPCPGKILTTQNNIKINSVEASPNNSGQNNSKGWYRQTIYHKVGGDIFWNSINLSISLFTRPNRFAKY